MKITIKELRSILRSVLNEAPGLSATGVSHIRNAISPQMADREAIGSLATNDQNDGDDEELPPHLRNPTEDPEDCFGPVPPDDTTNSHSLMDPYSVSWGPLPRREM